MTRPKRAALRRAAPLPHVPVRDGLGPLQPPDPQLPDLRHLRGGHRDLPARAVHPVITRPLPAGCQTRTRTVQEPTAQPLDLDDARAEVGEEARAVRPGEDAREVEDDEAVEEAEGNGPGHRRKQGAADGTGAPSAALSSLDASRGCVPPGVSRVLCPAALLRARHQILGSDGAPGEPGGVCSIGNSAGVSVTTGTGASAPVAPRRRRALAEVKSPPARVDTVRPRA